VAAAGLTCPPPSTVNAVTHNRSALL
jgi:hypothetical protein